MTLFIIDMVKVVFLLTVVMSVVPILVWLERKISAGIQLRLGPNRVGPKGLLQPIADAVKLFFKEDIVPANADKFLFTFAPALAFIPPALIFAVLPFGQSMKIGDCVFSLQVTDAPIGILFALAFLSVGVYGVILGGWASNNKYSFLGGMRACSQMLAYELTLGLSIIAIIMSTGSVGIGEIVARQAQGFLHWNIFMQPLAFILFFVAALAENNRLPFDLPECESELIGGYHTEYSSMKFALFFMGEYVAVFTMSALIVTLFLGGWSLPGVVTVGDSSILIGLLSMAVFFSKVFAVIFVYMWIRWTLPRFRYDQLMGLGWKPLLLLSMANVIITAVVGLIRGDA